MASSRASTFCNQRHQAYSAGGWPHSGSQALVYSQAAAAIHSQASASPSCHGDAAADKASKKRRRFSRKPMQAFFESDRAGFPAMVRMLTGRIPPRLPLTHQGQAFNPHSSFPVPAFHQVDEFLNLESGAFPSSERRKQAPPSSAASPSVPAFQDDQFLDFSPLFEFDAFLTAFPSPEVRKRRRRSPSADLSPECPSMMFDVSLLLASHSAPAFQEDQFLDLSPLFELDAFPSPERRRRRRSASADLSPDCPSVMVDLSVVIASSSPPVPAMASQTNPNSDPISAESNRRVSPAADSDKA